MKDMSKIKFKDGIDIYKFIADLQGPNADQIYELLVKYGYGMEFDGRSVKVLTAPTKAVYFHDNEPELTVREIEKSLNYSITNYAPSLDNIIVAKEDYYTNMIIRQISSNKTSTNNIVLKSSSINDLEATLKNVLDNYNKNLQTSLNETIKSSNTVINFWFAFLSVIIIIFTLVGIIINNRIIKTSKKIINKFNREYNKKLSIMKKQVIEFKKLKKESENNLQINSLYNLANTAFDNKDYNTSISYYNKVLELNNSFAHAIYNRAIAYYYVNNHTKCAFELITLYNNNKSNEIKNLILKNIIELANNNIEIAILFCDNENIDYKSLQQKEEKQSLFERIKNIIS